MNLTLVEEGGLAVLEGAAGRPGVASGEEGRELVEACFAQGARAVLLYPQQLPPAFFDLSSGVAGDLLQKLQNYGIRLAVLAPSGSVKLSSRFPELLLETERAGQFGLFPSREAARAWLGTNATQA